MSVAVIVFGSVLIWFCLIAPATAVVFGRSIRLADQRATTSPPAGVRSGEEAQPSPGRHLHAV